MVSTKSLFRVAFLLILCIFFSGARAARAQDIALHETPVWKLIRHFPSGYIDVFNRADVNADWQRLNLPLEWRRNTFPMLALEDGKNFYLASYDVVANLPSGRRLDHVRNGFDLYRLETGTTDPERIAEMLPLGGIDTQLYASVHNGQVTLCGDNHCATIHGKNAQQWNLDALSGYDFVEVVFKDNQAAALLRRKTDEKAEVLFPADTQAYSLAIMDEDGADIKTVTAAGIPWDLRWQSDKPDLNYAQSADDLRAMLQFDLGRFGFAGKMNYGGNNLEGRVAWSQVYYLNGMITGLQDKRLGLKTLKPRVASEIDLLAQLLKTQYPGMMVKRYSIDREPLIFALHLSRLARLFHRAANVGIEETKAFATLGKELKTLNNTAEQPTKYDDYTYLSYQKDIPFWADGAIVPFNYVSDYVTAMLFLDAKTSAGNMLQPLLKQEFGQETLPRIWRYWWGLGDSGWKEADRISLNTPSWDGNKAAVAHITYRSMDAMALIALQKKNPKAVPQAVIDHFRALVSQGWLLPYVNEELASPAKLEKPVAQYYARSTASWEIQAQVWAILGLMP